MRAILLAVAALIVIAVTVFWPPAAIHIDRDPLGLAWGWLVFMSDFRGTVFAVAVITFLGAVISGIVSAVRHRL